MNQQWFDMQVLELDQTLKSNNANVEIPHVRLQDYQADIDPDIASYIDHTLLGANVTDQQIREEMEKIRSYNFASVCINPRFVALASDALQDTEIKICTVIGFPLGANTTISKVMETRDAIANGADELDMVIPIGALKSQDYVEVYHDIVSVKAAAEDRIVKVILETSFLDDDEIVKACLLAKAAGANFVKTATGFARGGATLEAVRLMRQTVGQDIGVKASGGIRDFETTMEYLKNGANRIGTSSGVAIVQASVGENDAG